jgi:tetratricopeptide (TPR) repeat protein
MKNLLLLFTFLLITVSVFAQKKNKTVTNINHDSLTYAMALSIGDTNVAINALYQMNVKTPNNTDKLYLLANLYFGKKEYNQCVNVCNLILLQNSKHIKGLRLLAAAYMEDDNAEGAVLVYQQLDSIAPSANNKYQVATILYQKKKFQESLNYLGTIIADSLSRKENMTMTYQNSSKQYLNQNVSTLAAAYNMAGYILLENGDRDRAKSLFEQALKIQPDFQLAKGNLAVTETK